MSQRSPYDDYYADMLERAEEFQDYVCGLFYERGLPIVMHTSFSYQTQVGENKAGIEIKLDQRMKETGNVYIETAEKANPENGSYVPSGIYREDNTWLYAIGDYSTVYVLPKKYLQMLEKRYEQKQIATSKGFVMPVEDAEKYAVLVLGSEGAE